MSIGKGKVKARGSDAYSAKIRRLKAWHSRLLRIRAEAIKENPALETAHKWKELKPVQFYIDLLKSPVGGDKKK